MAQAGLFTNPLAPATGGVSSSLSPLTSAPPPVATGLDALQQSLADIATIGEQSRQQVPIIAPRVAVETGPSIAYSPSTKQFFVQGRTFAEDDAQSAIESEALLGQPGAALPQGGDWVPVDPQSYAGYLQGIKEPGLGALAARNFGRGVDVMQLLAGRGLQLAGAEGVGGRIVQQQMEDLRKTTPYERQFTDIKSGDDAVEWFVANLAQQGPNLLESIAVAAAGAAAGTATGGPGLGTLGGAIAGLAGKSAFKQAVLAAARKKAAGVALDAAENKILRSATGLAGATVASYASNLATGASDIYGELRDQGADAGDVDARMTALFGSIPYAALETLPEFLLAGRVFGNVAAPRAIAAGTSIPRRGAELLRRGAVGGAAGAAGEGTTEFGQEALLLSLSDQDLSKPENVERLINSFAAGAAIGGPIGAVANLRGKKPANLLNPTTASDGPLQLGGPTPAPQLGGPTPAPQLSGPDSSLLLSGPSTAVGPAVDQVQGEPYTPRTEISGLIGSQQQLMLPPPGAVLQVQGQPDFVVDEDGNIRAATPDDVVVGISDRGFVPPTTPGTQGVLDVFPGGQTTTRELRGMMEQPGAAPTVLLQPEGVTGEVPTAPADTSQGVLPFESGLAPRYMAQPQAPAGTLAGNEQLTALQDALARRQAQEEQFAGVQPVVTPEVGALEQRLAESEPFLDVMGTEGRLTPEPQIGVTEARAEAEWGRTKSEAIRRSWATLRPFFRNQWIDALNGNYTPDDLKQIKIDLAKAESFARQKPKEPLRVVVTGAITPAQSLTDEVIQAVETAAQEGIITKREADALIAGLRESLNDDLIIQIAERDFVLSALQRASERERKRKRNRNREGAKSDATEKPETATVPTSEQAGAARPAPAKRGGRPAATGTRAAKAQKQGQETAVDVQDVKADPQYKPTLAAIAAAFNDGVINGKDRIRLIADLNKDGDFELVADILKQKREAAAKKATPKKATPTPAPKAAALMKGKNAKPALTMDKLREEIEGDYAGGTITADQFDELMTNVERKKLSPVEIKAKLDFFIKGGTVKKVAPGEARGLRNEEKVASDAAATAAAEPAGDLTVDERKYILLNNEIDDALKAKEIYPLQMRVLKDMVAQRKPLAEIRRALIGLTNANKALTKKQEINRRDFLAGLAATVVIATGIDTKAFAQAGPLKKMDLGKIIEGLSPTEAVVAALQWIADNSTSAFERRIAAKLLKNGMGDTTLIMEESYASSLYGKSAVDPSGRSTITIYTPQGVNVETVLHELIHAYIQQRWAGLSVYLASNKRLLKDTTDRNDKLVSEIQDLWFGLKEGIKKNFPSVLESAEWSAAIGDADEMLSWVMTNPDIQAFMKTIDVKGNAIKTPKNSMWEAFKKWVMELLGMKYVPSELTALDRILSLGEDLIDAGAAVRTGVFNTQFAKALVEQNSNKLVNERRVDEMIDGMPSSLRDPVRTVTDTFSGVGIRTVSRFGLRDQVLRLAKSLGIKSAARFEAAIAARERTLTRHEQPFLKWAEGYAKLPKAELGVGEGTVSGLIEKMTRTEKWAFMPDYFVGDDRKALDKIELDTDLKRWYDGLSTEGQKSVREAYRLNYQQLKDMQKAVVDNTATQFDALIEAAKDETAKKKLTAEKAASLDRYRTMLQMDPTRPYAPLRQDGDWVVVGRSKELVDALSAEAKDYALIRKLEESADHYYVDFAQTRPEALKIARGLEGTYAATQYFRKAQSGENLYGGGDVMYAFQKLNTLMQDLQLKDEMKQQVRNAVAQLQLQVMASNSARKSELRRRNIATGNVDMVKTTLSHGRSTAQFIASVSHNDKILESLRLMSQEVRTFGPDREAKQEVYNSIVGHYMAGLQPQPQNTLADKLTGFSSGWMLLFSPSYYIQQALQNLMLTMPAVAARYGYSDTYAAFKKAYAEVAKAWVDTGATGQLNIDLIDEKYRPLAIFISESGALDVGLDREMGSLTADSGGSNSKPFEKAINILRGTTRKIEAINRLSAAIAVYELSGSEGRGAPVSVDAASYSEYKKDFAATYPELTALTPKRYAAALEALSIINETHGDYSFANASNFLRNPLGRVVFQFQKFRMIVAGLFVRSFYNAFRDPNLSAAEKRVARRTLMFVSGHAAIMGGLIGSPAAAIFVLIYNLLSGDDEERGDLERDIREAVGDDTIANLLLRGVPSLAGVDVSGTLGLGNLLSVAPYTDAPTDRESYAKYILSLTGPAIGGIGANTFDAVSLMGDGNYYKALERLMPRGIGAASKSLREATTGETTARGDTLTQPIDLGAVEAIWGTLGLSPIARVNRQYARNQFYKDEKFYQDRAADVKRAYVDAYKDDNSTAMNALRLEWKGLQDARRERGFKTQSVLDLVKAPREQALREKRTVGGVPFTPGTEGRARQITETAGTAR